LGSLTIGGLQRRFQLLAVSAPPAIAVVQHSLSSYDQLLHYDRANHSSPDDSHSIESLREPDHPSQEPQALPHAPALATPGTTGDSGALELCSVPTSTLGTRSHQTLPGQDSTGDKRWRSLCVARSLNCRMARRSAITSLLIAPVSTQHR
jgi:hypothetical protein